MKDADDSIMDVDDEAGGDTEEDEMSVDEDDENATPRKSKSKKKASKLKPRKSQIDIEALSKEQEVLATYDEQEIATLRLQKKYYTEGLTFIDQVESAMEPMCKLLGSTSKAEVLEVMDFFRIAHEYQFESAKVC